MIKVTIAQAYGTQILLQSLHQKLVKSFTFMFQFIYLWIYMRFLSCLQRCKLFYHVFHRHFIHKTHWKLNRKNIPRGDNYHFYHWFCSSQYLYHFFPTLTCSVIKNLHSVIAKWDECIMIERNSMIKCQKSEEIITIISSHLLDRITNLHRKSKYQQNKNIARSVHDLGIALCSYFVDILIFNANL